MSDDGLMSYFKFDDADLSANRIGVLSQKQEVRLKGGKKILIAKVQGHANIILSTTNSANIHQELQIGGKRFVATTILANIMQGNEYIIYYIDHSKDHPYDTSYLYSSDDVLSVELLTKAGDPSATHTSAADDPVDPRIIELLKKGDLMGTIKVHRTVFNSSFEESKKAMEMLKAKLGV
jgi:hypothetical protein